MVGLMIAYKGLVFFDSDGTITDAAEKISKPTQETINSLKKLRENGYLAILATGRNKSYAGHVIEYFDGSCTSNGAYVEVGGKCIREFPVDFDNLNSVVDYMDKNDICYSLEGNRMCYVPNMKDKRFINWIDTFSIDKNVFSDDVKYKNQNVYKMSVMFASEKQCTDMKKEFDGVFDIYMHVKGLYGDISPCGMGKGVGIKAIIDYFGISKKDTYAFGDGENDLDMFEAVGNAVAMGKHSPVLDRHASFVTKDVKNEGIAFGLKHFGLI